MLKNIAIINPCLSLKMDYMNRQFDFLHENKYTFQCLIKKYKEDFFSEQIKYTQCFLSTNLPILPFIWAHIRRVAIPWESFT